jgi:hypothetical protein
MPNGGSVTENVRIESDGDLNVLNGNLVIGTDNKGIDFSAVTGPDSGSSTSHILNDYEKGTWTGTLRGAVSDPSTAVTATGTYVKIGDMVTVDINLSNRDTTGASGDVTITGLPYTAANVAQGSVMCSNYSFPTGRTSISCWTTTNSETLYFWCSGDDTSWASLTHNAGTARGLRASITYFV